MEQHLPLIAFMLTVDGTNFLFHQQAEPATKRSEVLPAPSVNPDPLHRSKTTGESLPSTTSWTWDWHMKNDQAPEINHPQFLMSGFILIMPSPRFSQSCGADFPAPPEPTRRGLPVGENLRTASSHGAAGGQALCRPPADDRADRGRTAACAVADNTGSLLQAAHHTFAPSST